MKTLIYISTLSLSISFLFVYPHFAGYVWQLALYISPTFFPFSSLPFLIPSHFLPYCQRYPPGECDHSYSLLCYIPFARGHRETAKNLCRYSRLFHRVCPQSNTLNNNRPLNFSNVQAADRRSPIQVLTQQKLLDLGNCLAPDTYHTLNTVMPDGGTNPAGGTFFPPFDSSRDVAGLFG